MGNDAPPPKKKMSVEDATIEMKIQCKTLQRSAKKAEKEAEQYQKKAKTFLKQNNEEGAKMYLMNAAAKRKEALSTQRIALKMDFMMGQMKSMRNNQQFAQSFSNLAQVAGQQMGNFDAVKMSEQMDMFNTKMDEVMINNKMITEVMNTNDIQHDNMVEDMKEALQQEIAMEQKNKLAEQEKIEYQKHKEESDKFMDQLKGL